MSFHLVAYAESQNTGGSLTEFAAVPDTSVSYSGDTIFVPTFANKLGFVYAAGASITRARLETPSMREHLLSEIVPLNAGDVEPLSPARIADYTQSPRELVPTEIMQAKMAGSEGSAEYKVMVVGLLGEVEAVPPGQIVTVRATGSTTLNAYEWTPVNLTFDQQLEAGTYAVVGMRAQSDGCIAARLILPGSPYRPGCLGTDAVSDRDVSLFRYGKLGRWGTFEHTTTLQAEFLSASADTSEVVYLDLIGPL